MRKSMSERTADLVVGAEDTNGLSQVPVREYGEVYTFLSSQAPDALVSLNWYYVDPILRRKFSTSCVRQAILLGQNSLEISSFTASALERTEDPCEVEMGNFTLGASGIFEPGKLFDRYRSLRQSIQHPEQAEPSGRLNASVSEFRNSSPAA